MLNLIHNEWLKIFRRIGTYVMIGLIIIGVIAMGTIQKVYPNNTEKNPNWKMEVSAQIKNDEAEMKRMPKLAQAEYKQKIEINKYRLEHNIAPQTGNSMFSFINGSTGLITFAGLFTIIIAAGIVASEFGWGTIKLLLIRPIKRSKILLSKYLTVLLFGVLMTAILFVSAALIGLILFGTGLAGDNIHLAYANGHVVEQNMLWFLLKKFLLSSIDVLMLATMAFMISAVFRNSSLAIGISIFLLVMGSNATFLLSLKFDWAKYILFANTDLMQYVDGSPMVKGMTLGFSITMLIIYFVIFHLLAFGVFMKRDVAA